jgi:UPF0716 protein FxsA
MLFLFLLFPFVELYVFYKFIQVYSFVDALFLIFLSGLLGVLIMKMQGRATLQLFQRDIVQGQLPANQILHRALVVVGGLLLFVPGIVSDFLGLLCILPGSRHLLVLYLKAMFAKGLLRGKVFVNGFGRPPPGFGGFQRPMRQSSSERDAEVVDIEPIEITHQRKDEV